MYACDYENAGELYNSGILRFGPEQKHVVMVSEIDWYGRSNYDMPAREWLARIYNPTGRRANWITVLDAGATETNTAWMYDWLDVGAHVVVTDSVDGMDDQSSMFMWASANRSISVQSAGLYLPPASRLPRTGAWRTSLVCDVIAKKADAGTHGTARAEIVFINQDGTEIIEDPHLVWEAAPGSDWVAQTEWPAYYPPTTVYGVAVRLTWSVSAGAGEKEACLFREPLLVWRDDDRVETGFASRYVGF